MRRSGPNVLFVNSGLLGHRAVARLLKGLTASEASFRSEHVDLSDDLSPFDRVVRRVMSLRLAPTTGPVANVDLRRWRQELNVGWLAARRIRAVERRTSEAFDVLHFHPQATAYASLSRMERTPSIVSIDATGLLAMERSRSFSRFSHRPSIAHDRAVFRAAGAIVAASAWAANDLATLYPDCARKVQVMPYPIDSRLFNSSWADERVARTSADTGHPVRVLFVGGDFPRKGGYELLGAWREGAFAGRAVLDLVTDWPLSAGELPPGVNLVQGVSSYSQEWFELWRQADLFVMPTRHEAFGMVYQEAAAAAIPAVATGIHAIPEIVQDGRTGLIVDPGDQDGLVRAMRTLVDSPELRNRMGQAARCRIASVADPALYASKLRNLVQRMVIANVENPS